jgi:hypothetical protein
MLRPPMQGNLPTQVVMMQGNFDWEVNVAYAKPCCKGLQWLVRSRDRAARESTGRAHMIRASRISIARLPLGRDERRSGPPFV